MAPNAGFQDLDVARLLAKRSLESIFELIEDVRDLVLGGIDAEEARGVLDQSLTELSSCLKAFAPVMSDLGEELALAGASDPVATLWDVHAPSAHQVVFEAIPYVMANVIGVNPTFSPMAQRRFGAAFDANWRKIVADVLKLGPLDPHELRVRIQKEWARAVSERRKHRFKVPPGQAANATVAGFLFDRPGAKLREISKATGMSKSAIARTTAWRALRSEKGRRARHLTNRMNRIDPKRSSD